MRHLLVYLFLLSFSSSLAQEVICNVRVLSNQIQSSDKKKFQSLQTAIREFVNNKKWTSEVFQDEERMECNIMFNILEEVSTDEYKGTLQIQFSRPVYSSSYFSPLLNYLDNDIQFSYIEYQTLEFNENTHLSNLTSLISFYIYTAIHSIITLFLKTLSCLHAKSPINSNQCPECKEKGWKAYESNKNRFWIAEEL